MKVIDYAHYTPAQTKRQTIRMAFNIAIEGLLFFAFLTLAIGVLSLL